MVSVNETVIRPRGPLQRLFAGLHRFKYVLAPVSFGIGLGSFLLIERSPWIAQWLAVLLLVTWVVSVFEVVVPQRLPPGLARFITQQTHQEAFFFTLPFLWKTTTWHTGQAWFTGGVIAAALASMWDPLYFGVISKRRWLYLAFHALAVYLVVLISVPILLRMTTTQALALAAIAVALVAAPSLGEAPTPQGRYSGLLLFLGGIALAGVAWFARGGVPTGTLWVNEAAITTEIDVPNRRPVERLAEVPLAKARGDGVYAFTAIKAPRGLREKVIHRWTTRGEKVDIPLEITGGREQGYRAWTHKTGFDRPGRWQVQVVTESGQLIGELRFDVVAAAADAPARQRATTPAPSPPAEPKPVEETPVKEPPAEEMPPQAPPAEEPLVEEPPVEEPPAEAVPVEEPPVEEPATEEAADPLP